MARILICRFVRFCAMSNKSLPVRKPYRLKEYDYSSAGAYFITVCTHNRKCILSRVVGAIRESPLQARSLISKIVGYIKMNSSKEIHRFKPDLQIWQRNYFDHIIRDDNDYLNIIEYIQTNPGKWTEDRFYID